MSKELKAYALVSARRPGKNPYLSTTVAVRDENGEVGYCYIRFSDRFVHKVGQALNRGLMETDPAFVSVRYYRRKDVWLVVASYLSGGQEALLWSTKDRPTWLTPLYRYKHATSTKTPDRARSRGA